MPIAEAAILSTRRCRLCGAHLASDNLTDQCSCHTYQGRHVPGYAIALAEGADGAGLAALCASLAGGRQSGNRPRDFREARTGRNQEWLRLYEEQGLSPTQIALRYGASPMTVKSGLQRARETADPNRPHRSLSGPERQAAADKRHAEWLQLYNDGTPRAEIAARYGVSYQTVHKHTPDGSTKENPSRKDR